MRWKKIEHFVVPRIIPLTKCMKKLWYTGHIFPSDKIRMTSVTSFRFHLSWVTSHSSLIRYIPYLTQTPSGPQNSLPEKIMLLSVCGGLPMSGKVILLFLVLLGITCRMFHLITSSFHQLFSERGNLCDAGTVYIYSIDSASPATLHAIHVNRRVFHYQLVRCKMGADLAATKHR